MAFFGEFNHSLDKKGRIIMPAKFREHLKNGVVVAKSPDGCLIVFQKKEWPKIEEKISQLGPEHDSRMISRILFSGASEEKVDKQGRLPIPLILRTYASLTDDVVVIGVSNRIEIWDLGKWKNYRVIADSRYSNLGAGSSELGF